MKATDGDKQKHRQLRIEGYLQKVLAEQGEYAEVCTSQEIAENNVTDTNDLQQFQLFGRHACVYADVTNTNPVTITVLGVVK